MAIKVTRFAVLVLAALALTMESAHVLELPQKLTYDATTYSLVNTTLYRWFAVVGGAYQIGSIAGALLLTWLLRSTRAMGLTAAGAALLVAAFLVWLAVVAPVNGRIADALAQAADTVPALWMQLRARWEFGHAAGFVLQLAGFGFLVGSVLVDTNPVVHNGNHARAGHARADRIGVSKRATIAGQHH